MGLVNLALRRVGLGGPNWLGSPDLAMPAIIAMAAWRNLGFVMVIFLAGLQGVPREVHDAARIDGAGAWQEFRRVTLPLLRPTLAFAAVVTSIGYLQVFEEPYVMTDGGPLNRTLSVSMYMVRQAFSSFRLGYAGAIAYTQKLAASTLSTVERLTKWNGFLLGWYDTSTGDAISGPGGTSIEGRPLTGQLISNVDNSWFGAGLVITRQAFPELARRASALLDAMDYGIFFDRGDQATQIDAGQMYGGWIVDQGPAGLHFGLLNSETRIGAYMGIGTGDMPGDVWWRTWRTLPAEFDWQGQPPVEEPVTYADPRSGKSFTVVEGHYSFGGTDFVPSWGGSTFEGLMPNLLVPETSWGPASFGLNDRRYTQAQMAYARQALGYPVWGLSPSSTPDDTGNYVAYGAHRLASNANCCPYEEGAVTPHASFLALDVAPQEAFANIMALPGTRWPPGRRRAPGRCQRRPRPAPRPDPPGTRAGSRSRSTPAR